MKKNNVKAQLGWWFIETDQLHFDIKKHFKTKKAIKEICIIKEQLSLLISKL